MTKDQYRSRMADKYQAIYKKLDIDLDSTDFSSLRFNILANTIFGELIELELSLYGILERLTVLEETSAEENKNGKK